MKELGGSTAEGQEEKRESRKKSLGRVLTETEKRDGNTTRPEIWAGTEPLV